MVVMNFPFGSYIYVGFEDLCLNGWFVRDNVPIGVTFLRVCFEIGGL